MFSEILNLVFIFDECQSDTVKSSSVTEIKKLKISQSICSKKTFYFNENI